MVHDFSRLIDTVLNERRADQRFDDVAENGTLLRAMLFRFAVTEQDVRADMQLLAGDVA